MKYKWAIYKNEVGLCAVEYADTPSLIRNYPYIKEEYLPVIINPMGGYTSFSADNNYGTFVEIIERDDFPLTREQMFPKNSSNFIYGWISPEGDTYNTGHEAHSRASRLICDEIGVTYGGERELENMGWVKVTGSWERGILMKKVYSKILKSQKNNLIFCSIWGYGKQIMFLTCCVLAQMNGE